jgi:uncharacterized protein
MIEPRLPRLYDAAIEHHFGDVRQMLFLSGPRQAGKTTSARHMAAALGDAVYLNWDNTDHRRIILAGPDAIAEAAGLDRLRDAPPILVLDEIHKLPLWKNLLKGFFDTHGDRVRILVTGSAHLEVFRKGGDSLMGRYFPYRLHPLSVAELTCTDLPNEPIRREPAPIDGETLDRLLTFSGYPEPFQRGDPRFYNRWRRLRSQQLLRDDIRDLTRVQEIGQLEVLAALIRERAGQLVSYTSLANQIGVSIDTVRRWLQILEALYYCFPVRPWWRNVARALRKEPKYYLWDWSVLRDPGSRYENLVASALLKAVHFWTDHGLGEFELHFVRDKQKREVDFLVTRDNQPWFLVEAKLSGRARLSPALANFQRQLTSPHAFQVALDLPAVRRDCFAVNDPMIVPARTFLAQLI